jgi:hypothetical protein
MKSKPELRIVDGGKEDKADSNIFDDLEALRIEPDEDDETSEEAKELGTFAMVPMTSWLKRLGEIKASGDLCRLAIVLLYRANLKPRFRVTSREMFTAKVGRWHKRKLLEQLEAAGLIKVEWQQPPRVPWVTVLRRVGRHKRQK